MIRQTGGTAVGEISTRSSPFCFAMASAAGGGMIPSCCPVSSITRISRTRMRSLVRTRSSRRGERSKAINPPSGRLQTVDDSRSFLLRRRNHARRFRRDFILRRRDKRVYRARTQVACEPAADRYRTFGRFPVPRDQHIGDLLQLGPTDLIANLLLAVVELDAKPGGSKFVANGR